MIELFTELNDRVLRFDGVSIVDADQLLGLIRRGVPTKNLRVVAETADVAQFNELVTAEDQIAEFSEEPLELTFSWKLPPEFLHLNIDQHVQAVFRERLPSLAYSSAQQVAALNRITEELREFRLRGMDDVLRTIIFVLHRFQETRQVWGVGRGSSCASYILFLLGLHVVDAMKFDIPLSEFLHD